MTPLNLTEMQICSSPSLLTAPHRPPAASRTTPELLGGRCQASVSPPSRTRLLKLILRKRRVACVALTPRPPHALSLGLAAPSLSTLCSLLLTLQGSWKIYPRQENLSHHASAPQPRLGSKVPPLCSPNSFYQPRTPHSLQTPAVVCLGVSPQIEQGLSTSALLVFWGDLIICREGFPVHYDNQTVPTHCQMSPQGQNGPCWLLEATPSRG